MAEAEEEREAYCSTMGGKLNLKGVEVNDAFSKFMLNTFHLLYIYFLVQKKKEVKKK